MKAGTTTLYHDLLTQPEIFLPDKESNAFLANDPGDHLSRLFPETKVRKRLTGEICPDYTKLDLDVGAARAASELYRGSGRVPRVVYLVREPIARLVSHHHFVSSQHGDANPGGMSRDIEAALRNFPELLETSRYHERLRPWIEAFGRDALKVIRFEDYIANRAEVLGSLARFLGLAHFDASAIRPDEIHNAGESRPVATPGWRRIMKSPIYRKRLRPLLPLRLRDRIRHCLLPAAPSPPEPPSGQTRRHLVETLRPDITALGELMGLKGSPWEFEIAPDSRHD